MLEPGVAARKPSDMGDSPERRHAVLEETDVVGRRGVPALFIVDEFLNVLYYREDPNERRRDCRVPEGGAALPPLIERTVVGLLRRTLSAEQPPVLHATPNASVAVRVVRLDGGAGAAYAILVDRIRLRRQLHLIAQRFGLSARERQVLDLVAKGAKNSEIAARLNIAESTAIFHVKRLLTKTNSRNRTELVAKIVES
ncbi:MAG TPA: helix-turn-helix transcriptional regulator [Candidatus Baltobacteraceae bacterium]|nr:helix-turn-helix transcriptional regulator [Candidatus Baltobacteraceae bacterium]